jgi:hypothetical protein
MVDPTSLNKNKPPTADKLKLADPNLLTPLEWLLLQINSWDQTNPHWKAKCVELALPYCHVPKSSEPPATFNFNGLRTAAQMLEAQRKVLRSVGEGKTPAALGKTLIESLSLMLRSFESVELEDRLAAVEERTFVTEGRPTLTVIGAPEEELE